MKSKIQDLFLIPLGTTSFLSVGVLRRLNWSFLRPKWLSFAYNFSKASKAQNYDLSFIDLINFKAQGKASLDEKLIGKNGLLMI